MPDKRSDVPRDRNLLERAIPISPESMVMAGLFGRGCPTANSAADWATLTGEGCVIETIYPFWRGAVAGETVEDLSLTPPELRALSEAEINAVNGGIFPILIAIAAGMIITEVGTIMMN